MRRLPVGIAVYQPTTQVGAVVGDLIEGESDVGAVGESDGGGQHQIIVDGDGQRAKHRVEDRGACVDLGFGIDGREAEQRKHEYKIMEV